MSDPSQFPSPVDVRRHVARLSGDQLLKTAHLMADAVDADMVTACIFLAISRANTREISRLSQSTAAYSALRDIPPDDLREPVSVYAIAREISIPYETARRHVAKLVKAELCVKTDDGLVIPNEIYKRPSMIKAATANWRLTRQFLIDLAAVGVEAPRPAPEKGDVSRQVLRLSIAMFLEAIEVLMARVKLDLVHTLLYITIVQSNVRHLMADPNVASTYAGLQAVPPDEQRRRVSAYAVAREMRLPYETARRHIRKMTDAGLLARDPSGGVWTPASLHSQPDWVAGTETSWNQVTRLLADFAEIGVTAKTMAD